MAEMDRRYEALRRRLSSVRTLLRDEQRRRVREAAAHTADLTRQQNVSVVLMSVAMIGLLGYGRRLRREVVSSKERERFVETLQERKKDLRKAIEELDAQTAELTYKEQLLSEAERIALLGAWRWDIATGAVTWSDELYRLFDLVPGSIVPTYESFIERVAPCDLERVAKRIAQAVQDCTAYEHEYKVVLPDVRVRTHRSTTRVDVDAQGAPIRLYGVSQDVTERKAANEQLQRQEMRLAEAQRVARLGSWELEVSSGDVAWSDELHEILGYAKGEVIPSLASYMSLVPEGEKRRVFILLEKMMKSDVRFEFEHSLVRRDGTEVWLYVRGIVVRDADRRPVRVLGISQDITERKRSERALQLSEERFQLASRAANDVIWDRNLSSRKVWMNERFTTNFGYPQWGDVDVSTWYDNVHPDDAGRVVAGLRESLDGSDSVWTCQYRFRQSDGAWRDILDRGSIVRDEYGKAVRIIGAMMDITERRAVERMKNEFISTVSHELRTPLTSIRGALGLLSSGRLGTLSEKGEKLLGIASSNTDRLVRLINDILDIERIESGKVTLSKSVCEARVLANTAVDVVRALADRAQIGIITDAIPAMLVADADRIVQMLTNLLGNAVKFSPAGSNIRLMVRPEGKNVVFTVADNGRGIPADKLESIFERFQQVDASDSREKGGTGLGLAIVRGIARQHGGDIAVRSELGHGSAFTVHVPMGSASAREAVANQRELSGFEGKKAVADEETAHAAAS
jgi:PAS domain S-box-containing protein